MTDDASTPSANPAASAAASATESAASPSSAVAPVVRVRGVDKTFNRGGRVVTKALEGIDLDVAQGEFISLIGPSGCGKSTLLRIVGDLTAPSTGTVTVNGKTAQQARRDRDYGMVFQAPVLFDWRTVEDNVKLPLEILGWDGARRTARAREMLELVELGEFVDHHPFQLSGGMQQRVAIARALAFAPAILLMDEPFGALDEMTRERMNSEVLRIWQQTGTTILFVTHSIPEAVFLSSRVVVMSARPGRITNVVDVDLPRPRTDETRESTRYFELVTEVREALRTGGADLDDSGTVDGPASAARTMAEGAVG
ncbi:MAG: NitT/TauT family transport system ATP-binding protein [Chloroflexota bacterium]|jgi:NitT/TauT family transport system ATP-binding protein|nr:NitT/TauT family transport system ATP-binding protein [Chloroflexota bacterium]